MQRRDFLKAALASGALYSTGTLPLMSGIARANGFPAVDHRVLMSVMLNGGPDFRHLFPPPYDANTANYGHKFWQAKATAHAIDSSPAAYEARWENDYFHVNDGSTTFGIRNNCGWLKSMWDADNVAIVANAVGAKTRDHAHCILVMDQGDLSSGPQDFGRSGWGGRLAVNSGGNALSLTRAPRVFCYGPDPLDPYGHDNASLVAAANMRDITLYKPPATESPVSGPSMATRSVKSYYAAKRDEIDTESLYYRFVDLERKLRVFGEPIDERLVSISVPPAIDNLVLGGLHDAYFGQQIRNVYDSFACHDILSLRVASLEYNGWDSHQGQVALIENKLSDVFGTGMALDTLYQELPSDAADNLVIVIAGEFGRQLRANGDAGTDHGAGNNIIIIGNHVNGGLYGEMFPEEEIDRLQDDSPEIVGRTEIDHIFGAICDWVEPGTSNIVFPNKTTADLETGVDFSGLFT